MTREEFIQEVAERLAKKNRATLSWSDITSAVASSSAKQKQVIVEAYRDNDPQRAGKVIQNIILSSLLESAKIEAESLMVDNTLTLTEINRIFG